MLFCSISDIANSDLPIAIFDKCTERELDIPFDAIRHVLLNLKLGKAVGDDKISHNMLNQSSSTSTFRLFLLFSTNCFGYCFIQKYYIRSYKVYNSFFIKFGW